MNTSTASDTVFEENTNGPVVQSANTDPNPTQKVESEQPLWKANLSRRWSKMQPKKGELCDTFLDMKHSLKTFKRSKPCQTTLSPTMTPKSKSLNSTNC